MEQWKTIKDYKQYEVSNLGNVRSLPKGKMGKVKLLKPNKLKGYLRVSLSKNDTSKSYRIHRLVAESFIPNPENKPFINHIDCNPSNNNVKNLEWCTPQENSSHAKLHKITACGVRNGNAKLTEEQVLFIYDSLKKGVPPKILSERYKVHYDMIIRIKDGRGWQNLDLPPIKGTQCILTKLSTILEVENMISRGMGYTAIKKIHPIGTYSFYNIKNGNYEQFKRRMQEFA